ncbi:hypothetical protein F5X68DRAFT_234561 [Plectosphaerella plurivora]|uniref:Alcohol acetyltransferase n=1 Tax=Plectosphaerella plurivora TaxID=936078 RepID=A0A9P8V7J7_9PEZI|nr:hypothetical protein F5X68DRAFT_234561 [Plectosphaerella plurivora]
MARGKAAMPIVRRLGFHERLMCARNVLDTYFGTVVASRYTIPTNSAAIGSSQDLEQAIERAIAATILAQPLMQVGLLNPTKTKSAWSYLETLDLQQHIVWINAPNGDDYEGFVRSTSRDRVDEPFPDSANRPGWSVTVIRQGDAATSIDILFNWNHAYFDGTGGKIFHETLLRILNEQASTRLQSQAADLVPQLRDHILTTNTRPKDKQFTPSAEKIVPASLTLPYVAKTVVHELSPPWLFSPDPASSAWAPTRLPPGVEYETIVRGFFIDSQSLNAILEKCRIHNTTLTALLHGIIFVCLMPALAKRNIEAPAASAETAINLRRFFKKTNKPTKNIPAGFNPDQSMGNCVSIFMTRFGETLTQDVNKASAKASQSGMSEGERMTALQHLVWTATGVARDGISSRLGQGMKNDAIGLLPFAGDMKDYYKLLMEKPRYCAWLVTNIGVIDGKGSAAPNEEGGRSAWAIEQCQFTLSADLTGPFYQFATMTVKGGELSVNLSWSRGIIDETIGEELLVGVEKWLHFIAGK